MKISYNWLKEYLNIDLEAKQASEILTNIGLEVEGIEAYESVKGGLEGLVVGEVLTCERHPNADKLSKTTVSVGQGEPLHIVCGAPNVAAGQKVVVATIGTTLYDGDKKFLIKKSKIRGELSEGMICAEDEIGIGDSHDGIMVLEDSLQVGTPAKEYFKVEQDTIFEIGLTPNRIDAASHYGTARDLAAYLMQKQDVMLQKPSVDAFAVENNDLSVLVEVENTEACPRYSGVTMKDVQVKESPDWLKHKLQAIGMAPINNIVDITNFVLHETGQPLHAFDVDKITGKKVIVKTLPEKSKFITLDEAERELSDKDLMICNAEEGMCIAGVFGGHDSGVKETTTAIFIESACFNPVWVRKTAKRHQLNTDSSFRFERGTDPEGTLYALKRAALLIKELAGGTISSEVIDIYPEQIKPAEVKISYKHINRLIGKDIQPDTVKSILKSLEFKIVEDGEQDMLVQVPLYRVDVTREADIIEEILRIYGYNNIDVPANVRSTITYAETPDRHKLRNILSDFLSANGFNEIMSNSLTSRKYYEDSKLFPTEKLVNIHNPLSNDLNSMRQTLVYGGLESIIYNINRRVSNLRLYEFGNNYFLNNKESNNPLDKYYEEEKIALFITGNKNALNWNLKEEPTDFFQLKSFIDSSLKRLGINPEKILAEEIENEIFAYGLSYKYNKISLGEFGYISSSLKSKYTIEQDVYAAELQWDNILKICNNSIVFEPLPKFPEARRDLALLVNTDVKFSQIKEIAQKTEKKLLKNVFIFDVYQGKNIASGKKSYAVGFILQDESKTLTDKIIDKVMKKLIMNYTNQLGAEIR